MKIRRVHFSSAQLVFFCTFFTEQEFGLKKCIHSFRTENSLLATTIAAFIHYIVNVRIKELMHNVTNMKNLSYLQINEKIVLLKIF